MPEKSQVWSSRFNRPLEAVHLARRGRTPASGAILRCTPSAEGIRRGLSLLASRQRIHRVSLKSPAGSRRWIVFGRQWIVALQVFGASVCSVVAIIEISGTLGGYAVKNDAQDAPAHTSKVAEGAVQGVTGCLTCPCYHKRAVCDSGKYSGVSDGEQRRRIDEDHSSQRQFPEQMFHGP